MTNAEKRAVSTDALETLGTIIGEGAGRDAIHLAVEPVTAKEPLWPGDNVGFVSEGVVSKYCKKPVGIVDPFLKSQVRPGEKFWLVVYPRQITSLRHVWSHPDFPEEEKEKEGGMTYLQVPASVYWVGNYAASLQVTYDDLMDSADDYQAGGGYLVGGDNLEGEYTSEEFWVHYGLIRGREPSKTGNFFRCAC